MAGAAQVLPWRRRRRPLAIAAPKVRATVAAAGGARAMAGALRPRRVPPPAPPPRLDG
jgi:hypothetical protein